MKGIIFILGFIFSQALHAGEIVLGVDGGRSNISVDSKYEPSVGAGETQSGTAISGIAGYKFDSNIVVAEAVNLYYGDNFLGADDRVHLNSYSSLVGYSIGVARHFKIVPMVGLDFWRLESKKGALLSSGEDRSRVYKGNDVVGRIDFEIPFNDLVGLNLSYTYGQYDFGNLNAWRVGVKFQF